MDTFFFYSVYNRHVKNICKTGIIYDLIYKLYLQASAHSFKHFTSRLLKSTFSLSLSLSLSMHIYNFGWTSCLISFAWGQSTCQERVGSDKIQNEKFPCPQWDSNRQPFDSKSDALPTELAGLGECYPFKSPYHIHVLPITNVYIIISTRMTKDSVFCLVNVLFCVTYMNIIYKCCTNSKETHKSCACFQHANTAKHSTWSGICTLKASTGPMRLFVIC